MRFGREGEAWDLEIDEDPRGFFVSTRPRNHLSLHAKARIMDESDRNLVRHTGKKSPSTRKFHIDGGSKKENP